MVAVEEVIFPVRFGQKSFQVGKVPAIGLQGVIGDPFLVREMIEESLHKKSGT